MMQLEFEKIELTELANKLFMYCDGFEWNKLMNEVFKEAVWFDMISAGGEAKKLSAADICEIWKQGLAGLDAVHHQAGHYLIDVRENNGDIYAYAVATHFKKAATKGNTRTFIGSYDLKAVKTENGWRLNQFKYNLKCIDGNVLLE
jgi:hypothetical protein